MRLAGTLLALLASLGGASAQQLDFRSASRTGDMRLGDRWLDHGGRAFDAAFTLTREAVHEAEASFRDFDSEAMARFVETEMRGEIDRSAGKSTSADS